MPLGAPATSNESAECAASFTELETLKSNKSNTTVRLSAQLRTTAPIKATLFPANKSEATTSSEQRQISHLAPEVTSVKP